LPTYTTPSKAGLLLLVAESVLGSSLAHERRAHSSSARKIGFIDIVGPVVVDI